MFGGNCRAALAMAACTSCAAASMLRSSENWMVICETPWALTDDIESTPAMVENCFSSGVATAEAIVSGLAPGRLAETLMVGIIHARQVAHGQLAKTDQADQQNADHDQRGHHRPANEQFGNAHGLLFFNIQHRTSNIQLTGFAGGRRRSFSAFRFAV